MSDNRIQLIFSERHIFEKDMMDVLQQFAGKLRSSAARQLAVEGFHLIKDMMHDTGECDYDKAILHLCVNMGLEQRTVIEYLNSPTLTSYYHHDFKEENEIERATPNLRELAGDCVSDFTQAPHLNDEKIVPGGGPISSEPVVVQKVGNNAGGTEVDVGLARFGAETDQKIEKNELFSDIKNLLSL